MAVQHILYQIQANQLHYAMTWVCDANISSGKLIRASIIFLPTILTGICINCGVEESCVIKDGAFLCLLGKPVNKIEY